MIEYFLVEISRKKEKSILGWFFEFLAHCAIAGNIHLSFFQKMTLQRNASSIFVVDDSSMLTPGFLMIE